MSLDIWNAVCPPLAASIADQQDYLDYCVGHTEVIAYLGARPVGSGLVAIEPDAARPVIAKAHVAVLPTARRLGAGSALYRHLSSWAAGRGRTELELRVLDTDPDGWRFATTRGFVEVSREALVALDLADTSEPPVVPPDGIGIVAWAEHPGLARGMYEVAAEAGADIPGNEDAIPGYEEWLEHHLGGPSDRPEATFVAVAGEEVAGYAKLHLSQARPAVAVHDLTAVRRVWRRRGIARALKATQIAWAKRAGYERLETANELRNVPIRTLNSELGYREIPGRALLRGPVAPLSGAAP
ncbi:MAG: GNAT family N-acetyltransferase [Thermoleophilia bacterium]|nr:GNAT family N-acetyltransferase [Thermoleophilia bacterium]